MLELFSIDYTQWNYIYTLIILYSTLLAPKTKFNNRILYGYNLIIYMRMITCVKIDQNTSSGAANCKNAA